jgi:hypothetical protein
MIKLSFDNPSIGERSLYNNLKKKSKKQEEERQKIII